MVLKPEELDRIARTDEGDLAEVPFAVLLYALARARRTTSLQIRRGPLHKEILFEDGVPVDCRSNLVHETLSRFIVTIGRLDEATANACYSESVARSVRFGDVLIEKDLIGAEELIKVLQQNLARKLLDGFSWREGPFRLGGKNAAVDSPLKVNVPQLVFIGVSRFATQEQIDGSMGPLIGTPLALHPAPAFPLDDLTLPVTHKSLVNALQDGPMRIDELASGTGIPHEELTRALYALTLIEVVCPAGQAGLRQPSPKARPPQRKAHVPPASGSGTEGPQVSDELRKELMELVLNHRRKDAFELLGVDPDQAADTVSERFLEFAERFAPWRFDQSLAEKARDVFLAGARAYAELRDPDRRSILLDLRRQATEPAAKPNVADEFRIETDLLDPDQQYRKGMKLLATGAYEKALVQLEFAADLDPQNSTYRSEFAYCRFLARPATEATRALDELREAIRIDPRCGLALLYTGEILRQTRRFDEAEAILKRAIKPMAPDRRPIEALRTLAADRKTKR